MAKMNLVREFTKGIIKENPVLCLVLGTCPTLAVTTAASNAIGGVSVYPALPALADDAEVTVVGGHTANLAFHPMAFAYVTRPLANPDGQGVMSYVTSFNGISLRVTKGYDQQYKRSTYSMDVLYGFKTVYPELAVRALG